MDSDFYRIFNKLLKLKITNGFRISNGFRVQTDFGFRSEFPLSDFNGFRILKSQTDFISRNGFSNFLQLPLLTSVYYSNLYRLRIMTKCSVYTIEFGK